MTRKELLALGLSSSAIGRRVAAGRLHPVHPGVYAVGHPVLPELGREPGGAARLRAAIDAGPRPTRSQLERRLLALVDRAGLPRPQTNARVEG